MISVGNNRLISYPTINDYLGVDGTVKELKIHDNCFVDIVTGSNRYMQVDFTTQGQVPVIWSWCWLSTSELSLSLGNRVHLRYDERLMIDRDSGRLVHLSYDGQIVSYPWLFDEESYDDLENQVTLQSTQNGYTLTHYQERQTYYFQKSNHEGNIYLLSHIKNSNGYRLQLCRDEKERLTGIIDSNDQQFNIHYNDAGYIATFGTEEIILYRYNYTKKWQLGICG